MPIDSPFDPRFGIRSPFGASSGDPLVITASVSPSTQSVADGDTWADLLLTSATNTANYSSTAGTISTAVAEVQVDGGAWTALSGNTTTALSAPESVSTRVTVTDSETNERVFSGGAQVVSGVAPTVAATDGIAGRTLTITVDTLTGTPTPTTALTTLTLDGADVLGDETGTGPWEYVVPDDAASQTVAWVVTATNFEGSDTASGSEVVAANLFAPTASTAPTIPGTVAEGQTVTINEGTYSGTTPITITGTLTLNGADVSGDMVGSNYTIPASTLGQDLVWSETASNGITPDATQSVTETVVDFGPVAAFTDDLANGAGAPVTLTDPSITTPRPFQRGGNTVVFSGGLDVTGGTASGMAWRVGTSDWYPFTNETITSTTWEGTLTVPSDLLVQGTMEIKPINGLNVTPASISDIAMTDVFVVMGQSNASGTGDVSPTYSGTFDLYRKVSTSAWASGWTTNTLWPDFAEALDAGGIPPAINLPTESPGTGFISDDWNPGDLIYEQAVARAGGVIQQAGGLAGVVWVQGEREASSVADGESWEASFEAMVAGMQSDIALMTTDTPWFITLTYKAGDGEDAVRTSQKNVIANNSWAYEGLSILNSPLGDGVHYGTTSGSVTIAEAEAQLNTFGDRLYRTVSVVLYGATDEPGSPEPTGYSISGDTLTVTFDRAMANHTDVDGWSVSDSEGVRTVLSAAQGANATEVILTLDQTLFGATDVSFAKGSNSPDGTLQDTETVPLPPIPFFDENAGTGAGAAPTLTSAPTISGTPQVGLLLTGSDGTYDGVPAPTVGSYQWQTSTNGTSGWSNISGATSANYTPVTADEGNFLRRQETATNSAGSLVEETAATTEVAAENTFNNPGDLAATQEWWDGSDLSSIVITSGDSVDEWQSQLVSGQDLVEAGLSFKPRSGVATINGLDVVSFAINDSFDNLSAVSYLPVFLFASGSATQFQGEVTNITGASDFSASAVDRSAAGLWEIEFDATADTGTLRYNGTQIAQATDYTGTASGHVFLIMEAGATDNASDRPFGNFSGQLYIGGFNQFLDGSFGEIVLCDAVISGADLTNMRDYFNTKWGL